MAIKKITENPKITDIISFDILTPGADNCFAANPYKVVNVTIYYLERDFISNNLGTFDHKVYDSSILSEYNSAQALACSNPNEDNLYNLQIVNDKLQKTAKIYTSYYKEANPIKIIGTTSNPAWLVSDQANALITNIEYDENGNIQYGHFNYLWNPDGRIREGDYVICWTWAPLPDGSTITQHQYFFIEGDPNSVNANPTRTTPNDKYFTLLEKYLPEMYKLKLSNSDLTPQTLYNLNKSVASGFTTIENLANQLIDLLDGNTISEYLLIHLANLFNLKLRSSDPTLWRRQVKQAIPSFKQKGTFNGLKNALSQSGIELTKIDRLWQLSPKYTHTISYKVSSLDNLNENSNLYFMLPTNLVYPSTYSQNLQVWLRTENDYILQSTNVINFYEGDSGEWYVEWVGDSLSIPISLALGDILLIRYEKIVVPSLSEQSIEDFILTLPLMDQRDEKLQNYPLKNWNTRLITEDDPMFASLVSVKHPFSEDVIFGQIRTEFPYSENVYNMEEYNGSTRDSINPCDMDKYFIDPCQQCLSSNFDIYVNIENLSNDRVKEVSEIVKDYVPFHSQINSVNFTGEFNDFVLPPQEEIDFLISFKIDEYIVPAYASRIFNRVMGDEINGDFFLRSELADYELIGENYIGIGFNDKIILYTPNVIMNDLGVDRTNNILEVLSPSPNAGIYSIDNVDQNYADVSTSVNEPLNQELFTYNLYNKIYNTFTATISQDDLFELQLTVSNIIDYFDEIKTQWDVLNNPNYLGSGWKVLISDYSAVPYEILSFNPNNGRLILLDPDLSLPTTNVYGINAIILNESMNQVFSDNDSDLYVTRRGKINLNDSNFTSFEENGFIKINDLVFYLNQKFNIIGFNSDNEIYIENYAFGNVGSASIEIRRVLLNQSSGFFGYSGLKIDTSIDLENEFGIVNGANNILNVSQWTENSLFKEVILINIGSNYYKLKQIDGNEMTILGVHQDWTTFTAGGTNINYNVIRYNKKPQTIDDEYFNQLDRSGQEYISQEIDYATTFMALRSSNSSGVKDKVSTEDSIQIIIEYDDGRIESRNI